MNTSNMNGKCGCNKSGGGSTAVRMVSGNDLTVEALVSVYDRDSGVYKPLDLSGATDVALRLVGTFSKVLGRDTTVTGSRVSAFFPAGALGVGSYGVEIIFKDSAGKSRMYERGLVRVVESGEEAVGCAGSADGRTVTVDLKTRIITLGGVPIVILDEAAYAALEKKDPGTLYVITGGSGDED